MAQYPSGINPADYPEPFAGLYRQHLQHLNSRACGPRPSRPTRVPCGASVRTSTTKSAP